LSSKIERENVEWRKQVQYVYTTYPIHAVYSTLLSNIQRTVSLGHSYKLIYNKVLLFFFFSIYIHSFFFFSFSSFFLPFISCSFFVVVLCTRYVFCLPFLSFIFFPTGRGRSFFSLHFLFYSFYSTWWSEREWVPVGAQVWGVWSVPVPTPSPTTKSSKKGKKGSAKKRSFGPDR